MIKSVTKAIDVLRSFDATHPELGVTDLSRRLDLPPSVVSRLLSTLRQAGLVEQVAGRGKYRIGWGLFELGSRYTSRHRWYGVATDALQTLVGRTGHTAYLGVLLGGDIVVLAREEGLHRVRFIVNPGERFPAYATAVGKALLARLPDEQVRALYATRSLPALTDRTLRDVEAVLRDLDTARRCRYARASEETVPGIRALGIALRSAADAEAFAISLSYPTPSVSAQQERRIVEHLLAVGREAGQKLSDPWWTLPAPA